MLENKGRDVDTGTVWVDAGRLRTQLGVGMDTVNWVKLYVDECGFVDGEDFAVFIDMEYGIIVSLSVAMSAVMAMGHLEEPDYCIHSGLAGRIKRTAQALACA